MAKASKKCALNGFKTKTRVALQIQDRSQKSRPVSSLNQSQTQMTRPVATGLALQRVPGLEAKILVSKLVLVARVKTGRRLPYFLMLSLTIVPSVLSGIIGKHN